MQKQKLIILKEEKIESLIEHTVKQALEKALPSVIRRSKLPEYIDTSTLCRLANFSPSKAQYLRDQNSIKYVQHGRSVSYPTEWILEYLDAHSISPNQEVLKELEESESNYFSKK